MNVRLRCSNCHATFGVSGDALPKIAICPQCGREQYLPEFGAYAGPAEALQGDERSVFVPSSRPPVESVRRSRRWAAYLAGGLALLFLAVGLAVWPWISDRFWETEPKDPIERVAQSFLRALTDGDAEQARRLGTVEEPPAIRSFGATTHATDRDETVRGKFGPIAGLHKKIDENYTFDPKIGRFAPKNPLGAAGETLDALHEAKEKAEKSGIYDKMASGDPNDVFDAAENFGKVFTQLAEGALAPRRILPTYSMLVKAAKPRLPDAEKELALDFGANRPTWDALLRRSFLTLRADGPFILDRAEVRATVHDKLASLGDPPSNLRLKLVRFRLEGIDTGWKVVSAERVADEADDDDATPPKSESADELESMEAVAPAPDLQSPGEAESIP